MATLSAPYFSVTYRITSTRRRSSKSMSTSGMEMRSGLRKRSKISPCGIGSRSVMPMRTPRSSRPRSLGRGRPRCPGSWPHDEVGDDEEVAREAHRDDGVHLVLDLLHAVVRDPVREAAVHAPHGLLAEPGDLGVALGDVELRHEVLGLEHAGGVDLLGDQEGVGAALLPGVRGVDGVHLLGGLQVVAGAVELEAVGVGEVLAGLDAQQRVVGGGLVRVGVVRVVRHQRGMPSFLPISSRPSRTRCSISMPWSISSRK